MRRRLPLAALLCVSWLANPLVAEEARKPLEGVKRVVFLGDSITYSGQYAAFLEAFLRARAPELRCEFLVLGLPSETVSGLTEPGHAGGAFPRPDLHERLARVLEKTKPDLVVACYGMNDGIYHPFDEARVRAFREGIQSLRERVKASGAKLLHVTPPPFDPSPILAKTLPAGLDEYRQPYVGYDEVLNLYAAWLLAHRGVGWDVVDAHGPLRQHLDRERKRDPGFRLADDGVHLHDAGHWLIAREILGHWGIPSREIAEAASVEAASPALRDRPAVLKLVREKQQILRDAWLNDVGHKRPGMTKGLPLAEAEARAADLDREIAPLLTP